MKILLIVGGMVFGGAAIASSITITIPSAKSTSSPPPHQKELPGKEVIERAIGAAEGNLTPDGRKRDIYYGHTDPGNYRKNMGWCSDQGRGKGDIDKANAECHRYLSQFKGTATQKLEKAGLGGDRMAYLATLDMANQANPKHFPHLPKLIAKQYEKTGKSLESIAIARTDAFFVPGTPYPSGLCKGSLRKDKEGCWNRVYRDQLRRTKEIGKVNKLFTGEQ